MNFDSIVQFLQKQESYKSIGAQLVRKEIPARKILLKEGEVSKNMFLVTKGCLRSYFYKDGRDISFQFFFEGDGVASAESFFENKKSKFNIETIERSVIVELPKNLYTESMEKIPGLKEYMMSGMQKRVFQYMDYMMSYIKDKPEERYLNLINTRPEIIKRVPQHHIASYLGITPVTLSRIRNKLAKGGNGFLIK
jgi:CRP-like cAMP-binding protein